MIAAINIGNTNTAIGIWYNKWLWIEKIPTSSFNSTNTFFEQLMYRRGFNALQGVTKSVIAAVVPEKIDAVASLLEQQTGETPICITKGSDTPLDTSAYDSKLLGVDRTVCCYSALCKYTGPLVVFDLGTALSVSVVDEYGKFAGGAIMAGMGMGLRALSNGTSLLPMALPKGNVPIIGSNTKECLSSGALYSMADTIDGYRRRLVNELGHEVTAVITGGDAELVSPQLMYPHYLDQTLLLDGLVELAKVSVRAGKNEYCTY